MLRTGLFIVSVTTENESDPWARQAEGAFVLALDEGRGRQLWWVGVMVERGTGGVFVVKSVCMCACCGVAMPPLIQH